MTDPDLVEFLRTHAKLPEPGGYVSRLPSPPCGDCGSTVFAVSRARRRARAEDGQDREWITIDVHCHSCSLISDRTVIEKKIIGRLDTRIGLLTITDEDHRP